MWHPIVLLLPPFSWLVFRSASVWNARHGSSSRTSYSAPHAYSRQVAGCFINCLPIVEQFRPGKRLVLFDWCLLFYRSLADRGAVSCRETIGFVWLIFLVVRLCILYWLLALCADFVNGNGWFCLSDILTVIVSVLVRWKNAMSKKRRLAESFSPDAIAGRLDEKTSIKEEMEDIVLKLQRSDCSYILRNNTIQYIAGNRHIHGQKENRL